MARRPVPSVASPTAEVSAFTPETEANTLRRLKRAHDNYNSAHFERALRTPVFYTDPARSGWVRADRQILISQQLILTQPFALVMEVLLQQQAHQFVDEALGLPDEPDHGIAFRNLCERPRMREALVLSFGRPEFGGDALREEDNRLFQRVGRLLALAQSPNQHEAESAMQEAQRLTLKHNLDAAPPSGPRRYGVRHLGRPRRRLTEAHHILACLLRKHFFVEILWVESYDPSRGEDGMVLEICGTPANLEMAAYVHDFLWSTADRLWVRHKEETGVSGHDRPAYTAGLFDGFTAKLDLTQRESQAQGLVWRGDTGLTSFFKERHPFTTTMSGGGGASWNRSRMAGMADGRGITINRPIETRGGGKGGYLPGR